MPKQMTFASLDHATRKKVPCRKVFLADMEVVVLWSQLLVQIEPHYPNLDTKGGQPPMPLEMMLRV